MNWFVNPLNKGRTDKILIYHLLITLSKVHLLGEHVTYKKKCRLFYRKGDSKSVRKIAFYINSFISVTGSDIPLSITR
jgi:hypothetical protein